jgi:lysophospholipase L1-like esterase
MIRFPYRGLLVAISVAALSASVRANKAAEPVPRPGQWMSRHEAFVARARQGGIDVLFLGDSITDRWREPEDGLSIWEREFLPLRACNFGIRGDKTQNVLWRIQNGEAQGFQPKVVVLLIGTNNIRSKEDGATPGLSPEDVAGGVNAIIRELRSRFPRAKILLQGVFPRGAPDDPRRLGIVQVNARLSSYHDGQYVHFIDFGARFLTPDGRIPAELMPDGVHLSSQGYQIWAEAIREPLRNLFRP